MLEVSKDLPQLVRSSCAMVAEHAELVRIERRVIEPYAAAIVGSASGPASLDPAHHYLGHGGNTVTFILVLDAINFGSGYFPHLEKLDGLSGYFTVAHHLTQYFRRHGSIEADQLASLTADDCARIFEQSPADAVRAELMALFAAALNELGAFVRQRYGGSFAGLVEDAGHSGTRLVGILTEMPFFNDIADYRGSRVAILKRAQITPSDLNLAFAGKAWGAFGDLTALTVFADNVLPHVLRTDGVLRYAPDLAARIDRQEPLKAGSLEEVEIRACTVHACEMITGSIQRHNPGFCSRDLDTLLWNRGHLPAYRALPRHLCRTTAY
jgi:hypothetical protein